MAILEISYDSPYINGYVVDYGDGRLTLERLEDPTIMYNVRPGGTHYTTSMGDKLDKLAQQFYGNFKLWHVIASSNITLIDDIMDDLKPGIVLFIPNKDQFLE